MYAIRARRAINPSKGKIMKILIIRHGDPDYENDSLTETGKKEAKLLAEMMKNVKADACYQSPLGRAKETASYSLKAMNMTAEELPWLREFAPKVKRPEKTGVAWDFVPADWTNMPHAYEYDRWFEEKVLEDAHVKEERDWIYENFHELLKKHGYEKEGRLFKAIRPNNDTIVLFCHFGLECVLLSYMLNLSPFALWHTTCALPTSVTEVVTEERREGIAQFRMLRFGDISHLYAAGALPSFSGRFRECYFNEDERMD